jgi:hypothetical protein
LGGLNLNSERINKKTPFSEKENGVFYGLGIIFQVSKRPFNAVPRAIYYTLLCSGLSLAK